MNQQPDKFFRDKLSGYQGTVPAEAWNRVSQNLEKKNGWGRLLKVAAALLLLTTGTLLIYPGILKNNPAPVSENSRSRSAPHEVKPDLPEDLKESIKARETDHLITKDTDQHSSQQAEGKQITAADVQKQREVNPLNLPAAESDITPSDNKAVNVATGAITEEQLPAEADQPTLAEVRDPAKKNLTIVFTAEEVNRKYLTKNPEVNATSGQEQASGLRKLLDKAYDLKNNQDLLGSLRQKKNEILAMNFRSEKEITQNE